LSRVPSRRRGPRHEADVLHDERRPNRGRSSGSGRRRSLSSGGSRLFEGETPEPQLEGIREPSRSPGTYHRTPRRTPHAAFGQGVHRGDARPSLPDGVVRGLRTNHRGRRTREIRVMGQRPDAHLQGMGIGLGSPGGAVGLAGPRRLRLHQRIRGRAVRPGRRDRHDLRRHQRYPGA